MQSRNLTFNLISKSKSTDSGGETLYVEGVANKAIVDRINDYIPPEAWDLKNFERLPMIFFNHDKDQPVGKAVSVKVKEDGLHIKARISTSNDPGIARVRDLVKEGILSAFSVGFNPKQMEEREINGQKINVIMKAELLEVSIVSLPMNQESLFNVSTKGLAEMAEEKYKSDISEAKRIISEVVVVTTKSESAEDDGAEAEKEVDPGAANKDAFQDCVSKKIPVLLDEGMPHDQAVAVAMSKCREENKDATACVVDYVALQQVVAAHLASKIPPPEPEKAADPETIKVGPDGGGLTNNEGINSNSAGSDVMLTVIQGQLSLLGAILNELKMMGEKLVNMQPFTPPLPPSEPVKDAAAPHIKNETGPTDEQLQEDWMKLRLERLDLGRKECDKILKELDL